MGIKVKVWASLGALAVLSGGLVAVTAPSSAQVNGNAQTGCSAPRVQGGVSELTCRYTGQAGQWIVPNGVVSATFTLYGAQGGPQTDTAPPKPNPPGGRAAEVSGTLPVAPGEALEVFVGGTPAPNSPAGGFNGGGSGTGPVGPNANGSGGGGGATDVRTGPGFGLTDRQLVAGGGGGNGGNGYDQAGWTPGDPNWTPGAQGAPSAGVGGAPPGSLQPTGGGAGTASAGGAGGQGGSIGIYENPGWPSVAWPGSAGDLGVGGLGGSGHAASLSPAGQSGSGGGGGGGFYGGGGGGNAEVCEEAPETCAGSSGGGAGGGGGSDYASTRATEVTKTDGVHRGNGKVVITYSRYPGVLCTAMTQSFNGNGTVSGCTAGATGGSGSITLYPSGPSHPANGSIAWKNGTTTSFEATMTVQAQPEPYSCAAGSNQVELTGTVTAGTNPAIAQGAAVGLDVCVDMEATETNAPDTVLQFAG